MKGLKPKKIVINPPLQINDVIELRQYINARTLKQSESTKFLWRVIDVNAQGSYGFDNVTYCLYEVNNLGHFISFLGSRETDKWIKTNL